MAGPVAVDTPDYQRGVVSAQVALATVAGGVGVETVGVPPNAETLVITFSDNNIPGLTALGLTTGTQYPVVPVHTQTGIGDPAVYYCDVSSVLDAQVRITPLNVPAHSWTIYADSGVHIVADVSKLSSVGGVQYVTPTPPSLLAGDHPPVEMSVVALQFAANTTLLPAPGAGLRYRVFGYQVAIVAGASFAQLSDSVSAKVFAMGIPSCIGQQPVPMAGLPLSVNAAIGAQISGAGTAVAILYYTIEAL